jgi:bromodomain-containing factor 1
MSPRSTGGLGGKTIQSLSELTKPPEEPLDSGASPGGSGGRSKRATAGDWKDKADIPANRDGVGSAAGAVEHRAPERKGKGKEHSAAVSAAAALSVDGHADGGGALAGFATAAGGGGDLPSGGGGGASFHGRMRKLPAHLQEPPEERPLVPLNLHLRKCLAVLRDLSKQPAAHWFASPVDWRALNLPDYPQVVKKPMDLGAVKHKVETGQLESPDAFRDAVLLVFRNATAYNTKKDNVVHVAALELKAFFEEKFRAVVEPLGPMPTKEPAAAAHDKESGSGGSGGKGSRSKGKSAGHAAKPGPRDEAGSTPRARAHSGGGGAPGGMVPQARFMALQQQMELMQQQLAEIKRQTSQTEVNMQAQLQLAPIAGSASAAAQQRPKKPAEERPLTEADKEALKAGINALPEDKLPRVVEIIKERLAHVDERDAEIEVDLDALDAATLRHLQRYVKSCAPKKRKAPGGGAGGGGSHGGGWDHQLLPSPALPDGLDMDMGSLEADALDGFDGGEDDEDGDGSSDDRKRVRPSADSSLGMLDGLPFSQGDMGYGLEE